MKNRNKMDIDEALEAAHTLHWFCNRNYMEIGDNLYSIMRELGYTPKFGEHGFDVDNPLYADLKAGRIDPRALLTMIQRAFGRKLSTELSPPCG